MSKVTLRFSYTEAVVPRRCRKARPVRYHDGVLCFAVKEITASDAPVAIVAERTEGVGPALKWDYRFYAGKLWTAVRLADTEPCGYTHEENDWQHPVIPAEVDVTTTWSRGSNYMLTLSYDPTRPKGVVAGAIRKQMKDHLIIDGAFYRPAGEPRYVVITFGLGDNHGGTAVMVDARYNPNIGKSRYFSLLQRDEALALATTIAINRGDSLSLPMKANGPTYQVLMPQAIRVKPGKQHGEGSKFLNQIDALTQISGGASVVGIITLALAAAKAG